MNKEKLLLQLRIKDRKEFGDQVDPYFINSKNNDKMLYNNHLNNKK